MSGAFEPIRWAKNVPPMKCPDGRADTSAHHVLLVLATYADTNGSNARPSVTTLARETYLGERTVREALKRLQHDGLITATGDLNGTTVWRLVLTKTREPDDAEERRREHTRALNAARQARHRERRRNALVQRDVTPYYDTSNALVQRDVTHQLALHPQVSNGVPALLPANDLPIDISRRRRNGEVRRYGNTDPPSASPRRAPQIGELFEEFWAAYPRRVERKKAERAWAQAIKGGADPAALIDGARRYAKEKRGQESRFIKHPTTWLNAGCWDDEPAAETQRGHRPWKNPTDQSVYDEEFYP